MCTSQIVPVFRRYMCTDCMHWQFFLTIQVAQVDEDELKGTALEILFDLVSVFGVETFGANAK